MQDAITFALKIAQGPVFRFAFAIAVLGLLRHALLGFSGAVAAFATEPSRAAGWWKIREHALWSLFPSIIIHRIRPFSSRAMYAYHLALCGIRLLFHTLVVVLPIFMVAHVYLWERALGVSWPSFPNRLADALSIVIIVSGAAMFFGRVYSPVLRSLEPPWTFFKPLLLLFPFLTGFLARHPTWSPVSYYSTLVVHVLSAACVLALIPFARLLSDMHTTLSALIPEAAWRTTPAADETTGQTAARS